MIILVSYLEGEVNEYSGQNSKRDRLTVTAKPSLQRVMLSPAALGAD